MIRFWRIFWTTIGNYVFTTLVHSESLKRESIAKLPKLNEQARAELKSLEKDLLS